MTAGWGANMTYAGKQAEKSPLLQGRLQQRGFQQPTPLLLSALFAHQPTLPKKTTAVFLF
jgi:hypothetical protein